MRSNAGMAKRQGDIKPTVSTFAWLVGDGKFVPCASPAMMATKTTVIMRTEWGKCEYITKKIR